MMRPNELRQLIENNDIYKMSLGKSAAYEKEALERGALLFQSEVQLHDAVVSDDPVAIAKAGARVKSDKYTNNNAPSSAWSIWVSNIQTFLGLSADSIVLHWEADRDQLYWGVVADSKIEMLRYEPSLQGQNGYFFSRDLRDGWRSTSVNDLLLTDIHPKARDLAINQATINQIRTDPDFFRALLLDEPMDEWTSRPEWEEIAKRKGWH